MPAVGPSFRLAPAPLPATVVARRQVIDAILATEPAGTCAVTAAPGYGATTVLAQAAAHCGTSVAWLALDPSVDDASGRDLLAAASGGAAHGVDGVLEALGRGGSRWLIVDGADPRAHPGLCADLAAIAGHLPRNTRLAISSHTRMALPARAVHLDEEQLAFTPEDAFELVHRIVPNADVEQAGAVITDAEGWAAALVAGAASMRIARRHEHWLTGAGADALLGQWLARLPDGWRHFLEATAVLDQLAAGPAEAVSGQPDAAAMLLDLEASHCYLRAVPPPAGHAGRWWRRHGLLTALLRQRSGAERVATHSAAADWFVGAGDVETAMHHLIAAGRGRDAGELLTRSESQLLSRGRADRVLQWYREISPSVFDLIPRLLRVGWGQALSQDIRGADATLAGLAAALAEQNHADGDPDGSWQAQEALLRAYLAGYHADPATVVAAGRAAMAALDGGPVSDAAQLAPILVLRGHIWAGQPEAAARACEAIAERPFPNDTLRESHLAGARALVEHANGFVSRAAVRVRAALRWLDSAGLDPLEVLQFAPLQAQACLLVDEGDLHGAVDLAERVRRRAEAIGHLSEAVFAGLTTTRAYLLRAEAATARRTLERLREVALSETADSGLLVPLDQAQALVHLAAGDVVRAERIIRGLPQSPARSVLWARAVLPRQPAQARQVLDSIRGAAPRVATDRHVLLAAAHRRSSRGMAQGHLRKAAHIARSNGLRQAFFLVDEELLDLARDTAMAHQDDDLLWLLAGRGSAVAQAHPRDLSRGELQLLALLPTRARNAEIAADLGVSVNTVKTRLRRLYRKLGATSRDGAIVRARERGLL